MIQDPRSRIQDLGSRIQDLGSRVLDPGSWILDRGSRILDPGFWSQICTVSQSRLSYRSTFLLTCSQTFKSISGRQSSNKALKSRCVSWDVQDVFLEMKKERKTPCTGVSCFTKSAKDVGVLLQNTHSGTLSGLAGLARSPHPRPHRFTRPHPFLPKRAGLPAQRPHRQTSVTASRKTT